VLDLRAAPADGAESRALWDEYMALVRGRLPGFEPTETIFATPGAFTGPGTAWLVGYEDGRAVCCGGLRPLDEDGVIEIKRMFVSATARGRGHGRTLLAEKPVLARFSASDQGSKPASAAISHHVLCTKPRPWASLKKGFRSMGADALPSAVAGGFRT